jgi:hypothetical protein
MYVYVCMRAYAYVCAFPVEHVEKLVLLYLKNLCQGYTTSFPFGVGGFFLLCSFQFFLCQTDIASDNL